MEKLTVQINHTGFSAEDNEKLALLLDNANIKILDILSQRLGLAGAKAFTIYLDNTTPGASLEEKTVAITSGSQVINPTSGKDGMSKVTIDGVNIATETTIDAEDISFASGDAEIEVTLDTGDCTITLGKDTNLVASNIKKDVVIYGVTGTYEA